MTGQRNCARLAAIGGLIAAISLPTGSSGARADELADLRTNQELLQKRIDQLSQAPPQPPPFVPGFGPETLKQPTGIAALGGSFPRSFEIPGTNTSLRIGGFAHASVLWYIKGAAPGGQLDGQGGNVNQIYTDGQGGTGNLPSIPLNNAIGNGRSSALSISGRQTRFLVDVRTPTAWGEARAYLEIDFVYNNTNTTQNNAQAVASSWLPRLRRAYATLDGLEAGQDTGIMHDPDADPELVDFGGEVTVGSGRTREPQVKYTYAGPYSTVFNVGFENPVPRLNGPFGQIDVDTNQIPNIAACSVTGNTAANLPATTACLGSSAFFSPLQTAWPEAIATARINQPWGHLQIGGVVRTDYLNDSQFLDRKFVGYAGSISGDVHPFSGNPGPLGKDDLGFRFTAGTETGGQESNGMGIVTNFGAPIFVPGVGLVNPLSGPFSAAWNARDTLQSLPSTAIVNGINVRQAYDRLVQTQSPSSYGASIWYQHWWTENLRSTLEISGIWNAANTNILGPGTNNNKQLSIAHANVFWSPVAFVDFGAEYGWGHRIQITNFKGDAYTLQAEMRVRF